MSSVQSLPMHFLFYIINNIRQANAMNPCGLHMESCWVNSHSLCSEVESMLSRRSNWSPTGLHMDSTWILDKKLAGLPPKKKCLKSTWTPGIDLHMESVGEGKVLLTGKTLTRQSLFASNMKRCIYSLFTARCAAHILFIYTEAKGPDSLDGLLFPIDD